jgi:hypothetical protein
MKISVKTMRSTRTVCYATATRPGCRWQCETQYPVAARNCHQTCAPHRRQRQLRRVCLLSTWLAHPRRWLRQRRPRCPRSRISRICGLHHQCVARQASTSVSDQDAGKGEVLRRAARSTQLRRHDSGSDLTFASRKYAPNSGKHPPSGDIASVEAVHDRELSAGGIAKGVNS